MLRKTFEHRHGVACDEANRKQAEQVACYLYVVGGCHLATRPTKKPNSNANTQAMMNIKSATLASAGRMTFIAYPSPSKWRPEQSEWNRESTGQGLRLL